MNNCLDLNKKVEVKSANMNNTDELMNYCGESIKGIYGHFCPKFTKPFEVDLRSRLDWHRGEINLVPGAGIEPARTFRSPGF